MRIREPASSLKPWPEPVAIVVSIPSRSRPVRLTLTGSAAINGIGNDFANVLTGNAAANLLVGKGGADRLTGGAGRDTFRFDTGLPGNNDVITDFVAIDDTIGDEPHRPADRVLLPGDVPDHLALRSRLPDPGVEAVVVEGVAAAQPDGFAHLEPVDSRAQAEVPDLVERPRFVVDLVLPDHRLDPGRDPVGGREERAGVGEVPAVLPPELGLGRIEGVGAGGLAEPAGGEAGGGACNNV